MNTDFLVLQRTRINAFEMWCSRKMLGISWTARHTNISILEELSICTRLSTTCLQRALSFFGHVVRRGPESLEKLILLGHVNGKRSRGRAPTRWTRTILEAIGCNTQTATHRAQNRTAWRALTDRAVFGGHDPQP